MNYRHSFHAGNFADLVKHALVLWLIERLEDAGPLTVIDTHAGAGLYDLSGDGARSKEAEAGVARLMAASGRPVLIEALAAQVAALNPGGGARFYPGSPLLVAKALKHGGRYIGHELNPPVVDLLTQAIADFAYAEAQSGDGYDKAADQARDAENAFVLIDPPFEQPDDYVRAAATARAVVKANPGACIAVWTPIKDMETFDGFLRRLQGLSVVVAEARLRPLTNPMKMNGCAMVLVNAPPGARQAAEQICGWVVETLGDPGGRAEVWAP